MSAADLISLAERVEKAEGYDRANFRGWEGWALQKEVALAVGWACEKDGRGESHWTDDRGKAAQSPMFLCSLDAAMTLVPEGCDWTIEPDSAWVRWMGEKDIEQAQSALFGRGGKCTALALTAAALRARATQEGEDA